MIPTKRLMELILSIELFVTSVVSATSMATAIVKSGLFAYHFIQSGPVHRTMHT